MIGPAAATDKAEVRVAGARFGSGWAITRVLGSPTGQAGLAIVGALAIVAVFAPMLAPYDPLAMGEGSELRAPSVGHPFGTDEFGRDILSRVIFGSRISLSISIVGVLLSALAGVSAGFVAGYFGGAVDSVIMRLVDLLFAFPSILLGIVVASMLGPGAMNAMWVVVIVYIPTFARIARASILSERGKDYVLAARSLGVTNMRIIVRHAAPNCVAPLLVQYAVAMALAVLLEAALGFIGLGAQVPDPSWGTMLNQSRRYLRQAPWYGIFPGVFLTVLVLGLNLLADALRDAFDPKRARRTRTPRPS